MKKILLDKKYSVFATLVFLIFVSVNSAILIKIREVFVNGILNRTISADIIIITLISITIISLIKIISTMLNQQLLRSVREALIINIQKKILSVDEDRRQSINVDILLNNDVEIVVEKYINEKIKLLSYSFTAVFCYVYSIYINISITVFALTMMVFSYFLNRYLGRKQSTFQKKYLDSLGNVVNVVRDTLGNFRVVKLYNMENQMISNFDSKFSEFISIYRKRLNLTCNVNTINAILYFTQKMGIILYGAFMFYNSKIDAGELVAIVYLSSFLSSPIINVSQSYLTIKSTYDIRQKIEQYIESTEQQELVNVSKVLTVKLKKVKRGDRIIFNNSKLDFEIGKKYLLIGENGSGKSTLLKILTKQVNVESIIEVDDVLIANNQIIKAAYISQNDCILEGTILENITNFDSVIDKEKLCEVMEITDIDTSLLNETSNFNLSEGEKQRVIIARAIYSGENILIFDEAFSNIHKELSNNIEKSILLSNRTFINVSHYTDPLLYDLYDEIIKITNLGFDKVNISDSKENCYEDII